MVDSARENQVDTILAVDDNSDSLYALQKMLAHHGFRVISSSNSAEALELAERHLPSLILLDVMMPVIDGLEITRRIKSDPALKFIPVILLTAKDSLQDVVTGLDSGADGYITKPFKPEELIARTRAALRLRAIYQDLKQTKKKQGELQSLLEDRYEFSRIVGESAAMKSVLEMVKKVAPSDSPVLITGRSGTGKELLARAVHFNSRRREMPFIAKNCAAFSEHLLESQLFGHVKGAFTGAIKDHKGLFEAADRGTLFLDEIGEMALELQAKLLRVLQEGTFMPVGSNEERRVDVRIVAATNRDLREMAHEGAFREDLYYRLNVITIEIPALKDRPEDIPQLVDHFLARAANRRGAARKSVSPEVMKCFLAYLWRGNIRELENEIERMLILGDDREVLGIDLTSPHIAACAAGGAEEVDAGEEGSLKGAIEQLERRMIADALAELKGNKTNVAKKLGISRSSLISKVQQYGLEDKE